jgi:hypothetical protein
MATRIAWLLNLDAERELADPKHYAPSPVLEARIEALLPRLTQLLTREDCIVGRDTDLAQASEVLAFCPTRSAVARLTKAGLVAPTAPPMSVLRQVNSRAFCAALGQTLPGATYVRDLASLERVLAGPRPAQGFLLKRDFGFAGRERRRVIEAQGSCRHEEHRVATLDAASLGFARRSFALGQGLQVEPWCQRTHDFALHGYVFRSGKLLLGQPLAQHTDDQGSWLLSGALAEGALTDPERAALQHATRQAGSALAAAGYFGPYGCDAFRYLDVNGEPAFQPRSEINARFSMGYPRGLLEAALLVPDYRLD